jgi:hypothetical protein
MTSIFVKVAAEANDSVAAGRVNPGVHVTAVGVWIGLAVGIAGFLVLLSFFARSRSLRPVAMAMGAAVLLVAIAVPYAKSGLAWWGGPLVKPKFIGYTGIGAGLGIRTGRTYIAQNNGLLVAHNFGYVTATLDDLQLVGHAHEVRDLGGVVMLRRPCTEAALRLPDLVGGLCAYRMQGQMLGPGNEVAIGFLVRATRPGDYKVGWFRLSYHVGPLQYEEFMAPEIRICALAPAARHC